jgi:CRP-like cAMP-binding protein
MLGESWSHRRVKGMAVQDARIQLLNGIELFSGCQARELARIASTADELHVSPGTVLMREGEVAHEFYVVRRGEATVTSRGEPVRIVGPGSFFGALALLDRATRHVTVTAATEMDVYVFHQRTFFTMLDDIAAVTRQIMRALARRLIARETASPPPSDLTS